MRWLEHTEQTYRLSGSGIQVGKDCRSLSMKISELIDSLNAQKPETVFPQFRESLSARRDSNSTSLSEARISRMREDSHT